jgi:hypothetical protein
MGAMIIFSMLTLNTSRFFQTAEQLQYQNGIQYNGIALAQDKIEEIRWIQDEQRFKSSSFSFLENEYPNMVSQVFGSSDQYQMEYLVDVDITPSAIAGSNARNYVVTVLVSNEFLTDGQTITMKYIKSFGE